MAAPATTLEKEIVDNEKRFWEATKSGDAGQIGRYVAEPFTFVMGQGITNFSRQEFVDMMTSGNFKLKSFTFDEGSVTVRELAPNVAFIAYKASQESVMDGKPYSSSAYFTGTWLKNGGGWQCVAETESPVETQR
jgi:ketosteroid isomerase-like protein